VRERIEQFKPGEVSISYYGDEPLLKLDEILAFAEVFIELERRYNFRQKADIVTNEYFLL